MQSTNHREEWQSLAIRLIIYFSISAIYLDFMSNHAPLKLTVLEHQFERVLNACKHLAGLSPFTTFGLTSWTEYESSTDRKYFYFVQSISYLHYLPSFVAYGEAGLRKFISYADIVVVLGCSLLSAEIYTKLNDLKKKPWVEGLVGPTSCFAISATSIYSYRMLLGMWHDTICLLLVLASILLLIHRKNILAIIVVTFGFLNQYHWCILYASFIIPLLIARRVTVNPKNSFISELFPPSFRKPSKDIFLLIPIGITLSLTLAQKFILSITGFTSTNSGALYRIGIDSIDNVHHGGILGALQFLGGIRISLCLQNDFLTNLGNTPSTLTNSLYNLSSIFSFNCILSIVGWAIISTTSIAGFIIMTKHKKNSRWFGIPMLYALLSTYFVLQQSTAAHLQGRSILLIVFLGQGITYLLFNQKFSKTAFKTNANSQGANILRSILGIPVCLGIIINSIRLSFLLGING